MGANASACLQADEIDELRQDGRVGFGVGEIQHMYTRFQLLDRGKRGFLVAHDLALIPELAMNPLCSRIIRMFDPHDNDHIDFRTFVQTLWSLSPACPMERKLDAIFGVFDVDRDGRIKQSDLVQVLKFMVGNELDHSELEEIASHTVMAHSSTGSLSKKEFLEAIGPHNLAAFTLQSGSVYSTHIHL